MRRTLTVLVTAAALLVPATAASAGQGNKVDRVKTNASCSNGKGGNDGGNYLTYNGNGNTAKAIAGGCVAPPAVPVEVVVDIVEDTDTVPPPPGIGS